MIVGEYAVVEMAEHHVVNPQRRLMVLHPHPIDILLLTVLPQGGRQRQIVRRSKRPLVMTNLVEALVIEHSQQTGIGGCTVWILYLQAPLLLLPRNKTIAEGFPCQAQLLVRHRTLDGLVMAVTHAILHPGIGQQQAIAIFFLVGKLAINQFTVLLHLALLNDFLAGIDGVENVQVGSTAAHLQGDWRSIVGELLV